jgi:hypothetical protein
MNEKKPYLKLAPNLPLTIVFETLPANAKEYADTFNEGKMKYLYFVSVIAQDGLTEQPHAWYATDRQHKEMLSKGIQEGVKYTVVKKQLPGDKYPQFMIAETYSNPNQQIAQKVELVDQIFGSENKTPINAHKASTAKDGMTMGMCFKIACDFHLENGDVNDIVEVKKLTNLLYKTFQELMSE